MALPVNVTREALRSQQLADWRFAARSRSSVFFEFDHRVSNRLPLEPFTKFHVRRRSVRPACVLAARRSARMRPLTEDETKIFFEKLSS